MSDLRRIGLAKILVDYSISVKPGEWVVIMGDIHAEPLIADVVEQVLHAGGNPTLQLDSERINEIMLKNGNQQQLTWASPAYKKAAELADAIIMILASNNTRNLTNIDPEKQKFKAQSQNEVNKILLKRHKTNPIRFVGTQYPCHAYAQDAEMSLTDFENFVYQATFADRKDAVGEWRKVHVRQQRLVDWLIGKQEVQIRSKNAELDFSIAGRSFINSDGKHNMPSGEIYTSPVEESVQGNVKFSFPAIMAGREIEGVSLRFENGRVVEASADKNEDFLLKMLDLDEGARYVGEFGIGTNFGITKFTKSMLYDEKMGGTFHLALGSGYPESGGKNQSGIHWDMLCDLREEGEILVDGERFFSDGSIMIA